MRNVKVIFNTILSITALISSTAFAQSDLNCIDKNNYYLCNYKGYDSSSNTKQLGQIPNSTIYNSTSVSTNSDQLINKVKSIPNPTPIAPVLASVNLPLTYFTEEKIIDCLDMFKEAIANPRSMWWKTPPSSILLSKEGYVKNSWGTAVARVQNGYVQLLLT